MSAITQIFLDLSTTFLAFGIGLIVFKRLKRFYRILFFQVLIYLFVDVAATVFVPVNNGWLYNVLIVIEAGFLLFAAQAYFNTQRSKKVLILLFGVFLSVFFADVFIFTGIVKFAHHAAITEGIILTGVYLFLLYEQLKQKIDRSSKAMIIASTGIALYFAGTIPYLGIMFYLRELDAALSKELFNNIVIVLALVRYLLVAIAFFIVAIKQKK